MGEDLLLAVFCICDILFVMSVWAGRLREARFLLYPLVFCPNVCFLVFVLSCLCARVFTVVILNPCVCFPVFLPSWVFFHCCVCTLVFAPSCFYPRCVLPLLSYYPCVCTLVVFVFQYLYSRACVSVIIHL